ncbi:HdeD family acid-resistance protein [Brucella intermedia GD04153]|uniref:HdeD family acid-resistance protein n=1 Tax=Brucella intermedia GD04153 TaxID=2975438 RepID=A0AA42KSA3_9HYPH|nr:HdeD family acid-resistance protein [Brucella intermedia]MDH0123247.1 HdeD family acid-resistance protein [Brucella intermedia GD04153]
MDIQQLQLMERKTVEQRKWKGFLGIGILLFAGGILCLFLPAISDFAASTMFGLVLMAIGIVKIIQSLWIKSWAGFVWQELSGVVELIGGIMIYLNPFKGALAITLLIAIVVFVHGFLQLALSWKIRPAGGWWWFTLSGLIAWSASAALVAKWPLTRDLPSGSIAGIALMIAGVAYIGIALSTRNA